MYFGSDNQSGATQQVLQFLTEASQGVSNGYGSDEWTNKAVAKLQDVFECDLDVYFVTTGTIANCLAFSSLIKNPWEVILCHHSAHFYTTESTAPELFTGGSRVVPITSANDCKLTSASLIDYFAKHNDSIHNAKPSVVSITQATENGLVYSLEEIQAISSVCQQHNLKLHVDGARFTNALVSLDCTPAELTWKSGVDVLCLGATKLGVMCAEAIIFFDKELARDFKLRIKRAGQLVSKGRFLGAQFVGWLHDDHWLMLAKKANEQAANLSRLLTAVDGIRLVYPVQTNQIFIALPKNMADKLKQNGADFFEWDLSALPIDFKMHDDELFIRLVTSFNTTDKHVSDFIDCINKDI